MKSVFAYVIAWVLVAGIPSVQADPTDIELTNFGQTLVLRQESPGIYRVRSSKQRVRVSNRAVLSTGTDFDPEHLLSHESVIKSLKPIFKGRKQYWRVEFFQFDTLREWLPKLQQLPGVQLVQPDIMPLGTRFHALPQEVDEEELAKRDSSNPYRIRALPFLWQRTHGEGVTIAVIDDGFDLQHSQLQHVPLRFEFDAENRRMSAIPTSLQESHGTRVAGILFGRQDQRAPEGIAPNAALIAIRQPDSWTSDTILSFHLAALAGADVVNCSWTSPMLMQPVAEVINELALHGRAGRGLPIVFSAGNEGRLIRSGSTEAALANAIVVGAYNESYVQLDSSNHGPSIDYHAIGQAIASTANQNDYRLLDGTSLAAAVVTGTIALLMSTDANITLQEIELRLSDILPKPVPPISLQTNPVQPHPVQPNPIQSNRAESNNQP